MSKQLGEKIAELRRNRKMTQQEMADVLGVKLRQYQNYETGEHITVDTLMAIGKYHGFTFFTVGDKPAKVLRPSLDELVPQILRMLQVSLDETAEIRATVQKRDHREVKEEVNKKLAQGLKVGK